MYQDPQRQAEAEALLGKGYDPHGGVAAMRREAAFYEWVAAGRDGTAFAAAFENWVAAGKDPAEFAPLEGKC